MRRGTTLKLWGFPADKDDAFSRQRAGPDAAGSEIWKNSYERLEQHAQIRIPTSSHNNGL